MLPKPKINLFEPDTMVSVQMGDIQQRVLVLENVGRTKLLVKDIERGRGWDEARKKYVGVKAPHGWMRGQNYDFEKEFVIHKNQIITL